MNTTLLPPASPVQSNVAMITQQFQNLGRHARNVPLSSLSSHRHHHHHHQQQQQQQHRRQHQRQSPPTSSSPPAQTSNKSIECQPNSNSGVVGKSINNIQQQQQQQQPVPEPEEDNDSGAHHYQNDLVINNNNNFVHRPDPPQSYSASQKQLDEYYHRYMSERHHQQQQQQQQQEQESTRQALPALIDDLLDSPQYQNDAYHAVLRRFYDTCSTQQQQQQQHQEGNTARPPTEYQNAVQVQQYQQQLQLEHQQRLLDLQQLEQQQNYQYEQQLKHEQQHQHQQQQQAQEVQQPVQQLVSDTPIFLLRLLEDLGKLADDHDSADLVFLVGAEETPIYAHWLILRARCSNFQQVPPGEICKMPSVSITPATGSNRSLIRWPQADEQTVRDVFQYIYTGQARIDEVTLFQTLMVSMALGLEQLSSFCEEYLKLSLSIHTACAYLDATLRQRPYLPEIDGERLLKYLMNFISEHSPECIQTPAFLNLSKEGITYLVSSDYFSLDEADIFRCSLAWAKHQTGVTKPTAAWSDDERARIAAQLAGVINHIRILQIDSQVFAEEMEPTGVIPIELSLASYRFAALSSKQQSALVMATTTTAAAAATDGATLLKPRRRAHSRRLFGRSRLLESKPEFEELLNAWYGGASDQRWRLLFRASEHAFSAAAFHAHCDGVGPTYVLVAGSRGHLAGGFCDVAWSSGSAKGIGKYVVSDKCFLFALQSPEGQQQQQQQQQQSSLLPARFNVKKPTFAVVHHAHYGPVFGAGADMSLSDGCQANEDSYSNMPHSYDGPGASSNILFGDYNFTVLEYEVFTPK